MLLAGCVSEIKFRLKKMDENAFPGPKKCNRSRHCYDASHHNPQAPSGRFYLQKGYPQKYEPSQCIYYAVSHYNQRTQNGHERSQCA